jgi:hypothetical protein
MWNVEKLMWDNVIARDRYQEEVRLREREVMPPDNENWNAVLRKSLWWGPLHLHYAPHDQPTPLLPLVENAEERRCLDRGERMSRGGEKRSGERMARERREDAHKPKTEERGEERRCLQQG